MDNFDLTWYLVGVSRSRGRAFAPICIRPDKQKHPRSAPVPKARLERATGHGRTRSGGPAPGSRALQSSRGATRERVLRGIPGAHASHFRLRARERGQDTHRGPGSQSEKHARNRPGNSQHTKRASPACQRSHSCTPVGPKRNRFRSAKPTPAAARPNSPVSGGLREARVCHDPGYPHAPSPAHSRADRPSASAWHLSTHTRPAARGAGPPARTYTYVHAGTAVLRGGPRGHRAAA